MKKLMLVALISLAVVVQVKADEAFDRENGISPLHKASVNNKLDEVRRLLKEGANVHSKNINGWTPLHSAALEGHVDVVTELIKAGAYVNARNFRHTTPLVIAAWANHPDVVSLLIKHNANLNAQTEDGWTALHVAVRKRHTNVIIYLTLGGIDPRIRDNTGLTAKFYGPEYLESVYIYIEGSL